jgi:diguanylate cyclase (GGDEF)-like protein
MLRFGYDRSVIGGTCRQTSVRRIEDGGTIELARVACNDDSKLIAIVDPCQMRIIDMNEAGARSLGGVAAELIGQPLDRLLSEHDLATVSALETHTAAMESERLELRWRHQRGWLIAYEMAPLFAGGHVVLHGSPLLDLERNAPGEASRARADNELAQRNLELSEQATRDPLTGLSNRSHLTATLRSAIADGQSVAVLLIDLDRFKTVNDMLGHQMGDELLRQAADRLRQCVPDGQHVCRFGGDEFVVVLRDLETESAAIAVAERVLKTLQLPYSIGDRIVHSGASLGIAFRRQGSIAPDHLLRDADLAMYRAKQSGRNQWSVFDTVLIDELAERIRITEDLRIAMCRNEIDAALQGIFCTQTGTLLGYEALVRWIHPSRGHVPPDAFIEIAEAEGMLDALTHIVLRKSLRAVSGWLKEPGHTLSINVAPSQLLAPDFAERMQDEVARFGLTPSCLVIEITEVGMTDALVPAAATLEHLAAVGFTLAVDDFGKGASSIGYLRDFPIGIVKIDGGFVQRILEDEYALAITEMVVSLARRLDLSVVAECVETPEQLDVLERMGCERVQGYLLHRPQLLGTGAVPLYHSS